MRPIDWSLITDDRGLALITAPSLQAGETIFLADFKDERALAYSKTRHFLGITRSRGVRLGGHPLRMIDGVWYITEDADSEVKDLQISHEALSLQLIR